jgi:hypothetical protein
MITPSRRGLITGLISLVAAPAVVKASSLMAIKPVETALAESFRLTKERILGESLEQLMNERLAAAQQEMIKNMTKSLFTTGNMYDTGKVTEAMVNSIGLQGISKMKYAEIGYPIKIVRK